MFEKCPFTKYEDVICVKGVLWQITNAGRLLWGACEQCAKVARIVLLRPALLTIWSLSEFDEPK